MYQKKQKLLPLLDLILENFIKFESEKNFKNGKDFLMIGAMGHTSMCFDSQ